MRSVGRGHDYAMALPALAAKLLRLNVLLFWFSSSELPPVHPERGKHSIFAYINGCIWMQLHGYIVGFCQSRVSFLCVASRAFLPSWI